MNYSPKGLYVWDAWCMSKGDEVHVHHIQERKLPGDASPRESLTWLMGEARAYNTTVSLHANMLDANDNSDIEFGNIGCPYTRDGDAIITYFTSPYADPDPPGRLGRASMSLKGAMVETAWLYGTESAKDATPRG